MRSWKDNKSWLIRKSKLELVSMFRSKIGLRSSFSNSFLNSSLLKNRQFLEYFSTFGGLILSKISIWENCIRWSEIEQVRLPPVAWHSWLLMKILSIRVLEWLEIRDGWSMRGRKPREESWSKIDQLKENLHIWLDQY